MATLVAEERAAGSWLIIHYSHFESVSQCHDGTSSGLYAFITAL